MRFSERYGFTQPRQAIQKDDMDAALRNRLWDAVHLWYLSGWVESGVDVTELEDSTHALLFQLWHSLFKIPWDGIADSSTEHVRDEIRRRFFACAWWEVYNLLEFLAANLGASQEDFFSMCNRVLEEEKSAYRFVGTEIAPITSEEEIAAIEAALSDTEGLPAVRAHLQTTLQLFADRKEPDYRNSIKEAISAVESLARLICGKEKATLGDALKRIEKHTKVGLHPALKAAFEKLYGYTSDEHGIRHAMTEDANVGQAEAQYMLVACSAFVSYLIAKAAEAGIDLA